MSNSQPSFPVTQQIGGQNSVIGVVIGYLDAQGNFQAVNTTTGLPTSGGGGGGGGAVTVADGADVAEGVTTDAAVTAGAAGTVSAKLRAISRDIGTLATNSPALGQAAMAASAPVVIASNQSNLPMQLVDTAGTNKATVKAGTTAAVQADTSVVVQPLIGGNAWGGITLSGSTTTGAALTANGLSASITEISAASFAATSGTSSVVIPTTGTAAVFALNLTTFTAGSSTGLDCVLQYSPDGQTNWYDFWHFERLTSATEVTTPALPYSTMPRRVKFSNATGAATTATASLISTRVSTSVPPVYQFFDRTAGLLAGTASATSSAYRIDGAKSITSNVTIGAATTPGTYQIQVSSDGTNWVGVGTATPAVASSTVRLSATGITERFARVIVTSGATGQTGTVVSIAATT